MRVSTRAVFVLLLVLAAAVPLAVAQKCGKKTNIIVWMSDDLSYMEYGFAGNKKHSTPHLDRMAEEGVSFERAWSNPICQPTRAMIMTGEYATKTSWWDQGKKSVNLGTEVGTFAHVAKDAGYRTLMVGKWQLKFPSAEEHGFDSYCLWEHSDILEPGELRKKFVKEFGGEKIDLGERDGKGVPARYWQPLVVRHLGKDKHQILDTPKDKLSFGPQIFLDCIRDFINESPKPFFVYFAGVTAHKHFDKVLKTQAWFAMPIVNNKFEIIGREKEGTGSLKSNVEWTDTMAGRLRKIVEDAGVKDKTAIFISSDNGSQGYGKGSVESEFGVHVPLVAWGGSVEPRGKSKRLVSLIDLYATVAEWTCGKQIAGHGSNKERVRKHSYSLVPYLEKKSGGQTRKYVVAYRGEKRIIVRDSKFILDGKDDFWDCRGGRDERTCEKIRNPSGKLRRKLSKLEKRKKQFLDDSLNAAP